MFRILKLFSIISIVYLYSCAPKSTSKNNFFFGVSNISAGLPIDGGVFLRAYPLDKKGTETLTYQDYMMFDQHEASISFGLWNFYFIGFSGPSHLKGIKYCGSLLKADLKSTKQSFDISLLQSNCNSEPFKTMAVDTGNICPTGYIFVPADNSVGTVSDFCVMKYEAKKDINGYATSIPNASPWVSINQANSVTACRNLNALNGVTSKYDLISNPEWMTIARNIEAGSSNWSSGIVGSGMLSRGHTDGASALALSITNPSDPYSDTGNLLTDAVGSGWEQKRTHTLSNGEVIWDISGNVWEWIDWTIGGTLDSFSAANKPFSSSDGNKVTAWREYNLVDTFTVFAPSSSVMPLDNTYTSAQGIGQYFAGTSWGSVIRGSDYNGGINAGIYSVMLNATNTSANANLGFRCVYRP